MTGGDLIRLRNGDRVRLRGWGFFLSARLFHWNAGVAPLCCRKPATMGPRLLCAAADASPFSRRHPIAASYPRHRHPGRARRALNQANAGRAAPPGRGSGCRRLGGVLTQRRPHNDRPGAPRARSCPPRPRHSRRHFARGRRGPNFCLAPIRTPAARCLNHPMGPYLPPSLLLSRLSSKTEFG